MIKRAALLERISIDPRVGFGKPCIRDTRIWVSLIVDSLAEGCLGPSCSPPIRNSRPRTFGRRWRSPRR